MPNCTLGCTWRYSDKMAVDTRKNHHLVSLIIFIYEGLAIGIGRYLSSNLEILAFTHIGATQNEILKKMLIFTFE